MDEPIHDHIEAIATARDVPRLLDFVAMTDRSYPAALQWVRRWRPLTAAAMLPQCGCAAGRCRVCN